MSEIKLTEELKADMIRQASQILHNSYAPYSHYNVAAAVLMSSGKIYTGVNVESSLLSCTICAERNAIFHAVASGEKKILAVAIVGGLNAAEKETDFDEYCTPCGVCRQVLSEFCDKDLKVILGKPEKITVTTLEELLPYSFGKADLKK